MYFKLMRRVILLRIGSAVSGLDLTLIDPSLERGEFRERA
jgi:hypothetical protein